MHSGFVCLLGRPNVGKSTLLNALLGQKLAIVTPKPQTTRTRILGILNAPPAKRRPASQIALIDTPGVHRSESSLDRKMAQEIREAMQGCDLTLWIADVLRERGAEEEYVHSLVRKADGPVFLLLNKIDRIEKPRLLPLIEQWSHVHDFREIIPISAKQGDGLDLLLDQIARVLPDGPAYFPQDQITDQPVRFLAAEIVREQLLLATDGEVPYAAAVVIEQFTETPKLTRVAAVIYCEREGQKGIIIGRNGERLKQVGTAARLQIEQLLNAKVFLELFVKVEPDWRQRREFIESLDWRRQLEELTQARETPE